MPKDDVMAVNERLTRLEKTVAEGFLDVRTFFEGHDARFVRLKDRMVALDSKLDVFSETIRDDIKNVLDAISAGTDEMRRTTQAIRKEHEADRRLMKAILTDHATRIRTVEDALKPSSR